VGTPKENSQAFRLELSNPPFAFLTPETSFRMNNTTKNLALLAEIMKFRPKSKMKKPPPEGRWGPGHWVG
jgi:hypothetical protein